MNAIFVSRLDEFNYISVRIILEIDLKRGIHRFAPTNSPLTLNSGLPEHGNTKME